MRRVIYSSILRLFLCFQAGCSMVAVNNQSLEYTTDGPYSIQVIQRRDGSRDYRWEIDSRIEQVGTCRVKYHRMYSTNRFMVVEGTIGNAGNRYPVVLDTGASQAVFVKENHVLENNLQIYPMESVKLDLNGHHLMLCHLPKLQIGSAALVNQPCFYLERNVKLKFFGLSIAKDDFKDNPVIVGLPALRQFKYIVFDSVKNEVEFSRNELFEIGQPRLWEKYYFVIEEDFHGNTFLFVRIPIAGKATVLQLDTGSGRGLAISEYLWEEIRERIPDLKLRKDRDLYPYIGSLVCKRGVIPKLKVGDRTVKNAKISIFPNDSPLVQDCDGLLGMQYFQDTVIVLDFQRNLMWVKNHKGR